MDISDITDITKLKALGYDQMTSKQKAENNLMIIQSRIIEVEASSKPKK
jgi:hypothetical protein